MEKKDMKKEELEGKYKENEYIEDVCLSLLD